MQLVLLLVLYFIIIINNLLCLLDIAAAVVAIGGCVVIVVVIILAVFGLCRIIIVAAVDGCMIFIINSSAAATTTTTATATYYELHNNWPHWACRTQRGALAAQNFGISHFISVRSNFVAVDSVAIDFSRLKLRSRSVAIDLPTSDHCKKITSYPSSDNEWTLLCMPPTPYCTVAGVSWGGKDRLH